MLLLHTSSLWIGKVGADQATDFFELRVRPLLAEHCFRCHGPEKQQSGLRLDTRASMLKGGDNGPALVPGDVSKSLLLQAVRHEGDLRMPSKQKKLSPQEIEFLTAWVKIGAPWPDPKKVVAVAADDWKKHWAFQPIRNPSLPSVKNAQWAQTALDRFILSKLEEVGLAPSLTADRRTLIRRVTFDLIGLPPTPEEVAAFERDPYPDALARLVDRLLASPHYGERWGRHWLDAARYADTKGYVFFEDASFTWAWTYRDYVIRAFNEDLPYDRFVLEQVAADRMSLGDDKRALTALGFLTLGGRFMNNLHDILDDRIDVVTRGLMGLTVTCARCHDHKYDPIPAKDYYALYGVFASCAEPTVPPLYQPPPQTEEYAKFEKELGQREKKLSDFVKAKHEELTRGARQRVAEYLLAAHAQRNQPSTEEFMLISETGELNPTMIVRWQKQLERTRKTSDPVFALWHALADLPDRNFADNAASVFAKSKSNAIVSKAFAEAPPKTMKDVAQRYGVIMKNVDDKWHNLLATDPMSKALPDPDEEEVRQALHSPDAAANVAFLPYGDLSLLPDRASQAKLQELRKALEQWRATGPGAPPRAMVLEDLPTPYEPRVFVRGNPNNLGETTQRRMPLAAAGEKRPPFTQGSGRLELAHAIANRNNPLTARVLVNRVWLQHFGNGLVRTPGDFGLRGDVPSHPALLDWLATWFMDNGWSLKKLHRLILLSSAYQQKCDDRAECQKVDPENRLLWKMERRRLDFEATRDALLVVSGKLDRTIGGPSVQNYLAANAKRRTLYAHLDRLNVPNLFRTFDFPSPDATSPERVTTTVAPQALFLMNHPFVQDCAKHLASRPDITSVKNDIAKIGRLYQIVFGRPPTPEELLLGRSFLAGPGAAPWQRYAHALLMSNEFVAVD
ncbi:MAG: PSD1 and planctomycete cytochrome C domain-containing protein [Gemmataceae bacterium]|nr:PSD1 and planctomycete cytochrome C domain-containing protein [Gemmataceae bacterium]